MPARRKKPMSLNSPPKEIIAPNSPPNKESVTSAKQPSAEKRSSSHTFEDGTLDIILGRKGKGKTSFALDILPKRQHVIICPGGTNPDILAYKWRWNDEEG